MQGLGKKISVIIPVKNGQEFIRASVESVINQTYTDWELIVVNDSSTDGTLTVVSQFMNDPRIRLISTNGTSGVAEALNFGINNSTGQFFARLDCDDIWIDKNKLKLQIDFLESNPSCSMVGTWAIAGYEPEDAVYYFRHPLSNLEIRNQLVFRNLFVSSSIVSRMDLIKQIGGYHSEDLLAEDYGLGYRLLNLGDGANLGIEAVWYRLNKEGISHNKYALQVGSAYGVVKKLGAKYPYYKSGIIKWWLHFLFAKIFGQKLAIIIKKSL